MIAIETYAELCALMADTAGDEQREFAIAAAHDVSEAEWLESKTAWTARMSDPADGGKTALGFMPLYQEAQARARGGAEPCTLEFFAKVHAEMSFRLDAAGTKVDHHLVLADNNIEHHRWLECEGYWTPIVGAPTILGEPNPKYDAARSQEYQALLEQERIRVTGEASTGAPATSAPAPAPTAEAPASPVADVVGKLGRFFKR